MSLSERWFVILVLISFCMQPASLEGLCHRGYYLYTPSSGPDDCLQCTLGQFMPEDLHSNRQCYPCSVLQWEIYVSPCNATHDTEIHCKNGYYRARPSYHNVRGQCQKCTECVRTLHPRKMFNDSVCCPRNDFGVYTGKTGRPECKRECGPGQLSDDAEGNCITCPLGTYMDENRHINSHCKECQKCSQNTEGNIYEGRACTKLRDTVCCPKPNMTVEDARDGSVCNAISTISSVTGQTTGTPHIHACGQGEYLLTNTRTHSSTCQPCPQGTYTDETEHIRGSCRSCQEFPHVKFCPPDTADHKSSDDDALTAGEVAGLVVGVVVMSVIVVLVVLCVWWKRLKRRAKKGNTGVSGPESIPLESDDYTAGQNAVAKQKSISNDFIAPNDFTADQLPDRYKSGDFVKLINLQADLTVLLCVEENGVRRSRPASVPVTILSRRSLESKKTRQLTLSGWVEMVKMYKDQSCPCVSGERSAQAETSCGEIVICTTAKGRNSICYFFYDSDSMNLQDCLSVSGAVKVVSDAENDWCYMTFITQNKNLIERLTWTFTEYHRMRNEIRRNYGLVADNVKDESNLEMLRTTYESLVNRLKSCREKIGITRNVTDSAATNILMPLKPALGITYEGTHEGVALNKIMSKLLGSYEQSYKTVLKWNQNQPGYEDKTPSQEQYWFLYHKANEIDKYLGHLESELSNTKATNHPYNPCYHLSHPFTVVVSHPRGGPKKISMGEVVHIENECFDLDSIYKYTNLTDRGSEGARVFILGKTGPGDHGHSRSRCKLSKSKSGRWYDIVPYIADLSTENAK